MLASAKIGVPEGGEEADLTAGFLDLGLKLGGRHGERRRAVVDGERRRRAWLIHGETRARHRLGRATAVKDANGSRVPYFELNVPLESMTTGSGGGGPASTTVIDASTEAPLDVCPEAPPLPALPLPGCALPVCCVDPEAPVDAPALWPMPVVAAAPEPVCGCCPFELQAIPQSAAKRKIATCGWNASHSPTRSLVGASIQLHAAPFGVGVDVPVAIVDVRVMGCIGVAARHGCK